MFVNEPIDIREDSFIQAYSDYVVVFDPFIEEWLINEYIDFIEFIYAENAFLSFVSLFLGSKLDKTKQYLYQTKNMILSKTLSLSDIQTELLSLYELEIDTFRILEIFQKLKETTGYENKIFIDKIFDHLELNDLIEKIQARLESLKSASSSINDLVEQQLEAEMTRSELASERAVTIFELLMFGTLGLTFISTIFGVTQIEFSAQIIAIATAITVINIAFGYYILKYYSKKKM